MPPLFIDTRTIGGGRSWGPAFSPIKQREVVVRGKKRMKRRIQPMKPADQSLEPIPIEAYFEFAAVLGISPKECLEIEKQRLGGNVDVELDAEAQKTYDRITQEQQRAEREEEFCRRVVKGEIDWDEIREKAQNPSAKEPFWAKQKKFHRPECTCCFGSGPGKCVVFVDNPMDLLGKMEKRENEREAYGQYFLENDDDTPDDFNYDDFEAMVPQFPDNMDPDESGAMDPKFPDEEFINKKENIKKTPALASRPASKFLPSPLTQPKEHMSQKKAKQHIPKLKKPRMKSLLFPKEEDKDQDKPEKTVNKKTQRQELNPRPNMF